MQPTDATHAQQSLAIVSGRWSTKRFLLVVRPCAGQHSPSGPRLSVHAGLGRWHMQHVTHLQQGETGSGGGGSEGSGVRTTVARRMLCSMRSCPSQQKPPCTCRECSTSLQQASCAALWAVLNATLQLRFVALCLQAASCKSQICSTLHSPLHLRPPGTWWPLTGVHPACRLHPAVAATRGR